MQEFSFGLKQCSLFRSTLGPMLCSQQAVKRMAYCHGGQGGSIVNVSSIAAKLGSPNEYVGYAASKGALETFTTGFAKEVAREGIRVNCVRPGHIYTEMHASGGEPDRVDRLKDSIPMRRGDKQKRWPVQFYGWLAPKRPLSREHFWIRQAASSPLDRSRAPQQRETAWRTLALARPYPL